MRKITVISFFACLLSLFPVLSEAQSLTKYEYWFDDDLMGMQTGSLTGTDAMVDISIDTAPLIDGVHKLSFRVMQSNGYYSAVTISHFYKFPIDKATQLEYWVDEDKENSKIIDGNVSNDGSMCQFIEDLDLGDVSPGYHRLYFRAINKNERVFSAVSMTPIMVKPKDYGNVEVVKYSVSIDNSTPIVMNVRKPDTEVVIPHTIDARGLEAGKEHHVAMVFYNSIGTSTSTSGEFTVVQTEAPAIKLTASENDGYINLQFNSIPNDVKYNVYRIANGVKVCIPVYISQNYPNTSQYIDMPMAGTYEYEVEGIWKDNNGEEHSVLSNNLTVTTGGIQKTDQYGSIEGIIRIKGEQMAQLPSDLVLDVNFSDGKTVRVQENGTFYHADVPIESTLTMTLNDYADGEFANGTLSQKVYTFDAQTATVTKEHPVAHVVFEGERNADTDLTEDLGYSELIIASSLRCTDKSFCFDVQNISGRTWTGTIYLKAVSQNVRNKYENNEGFAAGSFFTFADYNSYFTLGSGEVTQLANGKQQELTIEFDNLPYLPYDEDYKIYIVSCERGRSHFKLLTSTQGDVSNPKDWTLLANVNHFDNEGMMKDVLDECLKEIYEDMDIFKKIDGPFKYALEEGAKELERIDREKYNGDGVFGNLPDLLKQFGEDFKNAVKDVDDAVQIVKEFEGFCEKLKKAEELRQIGNENSYKKWNEAMKMIFSLYEYADGPLAGIYMLYLDATTKAVEFIDNNFENLFEFCRTREFMDDHITFRIAVRKDSHIPIFESAYFQDYDIYSRIKDIDVYCLTPYEQHCKYEGDLSSDQNDGRQLVLKRNCWVNHMDNDNTVDGSKPKEFWMEIYWKNGRVTKIPIMEGIVDISNSRINPVVTINLQSGASSKSDMDKKISIIYKNPDLNEKK